MKFVTLSKLLLTLACFGAIIGALTLSSIVVRTAFAQQSETVIPLEGLDPVMLTQGKEVLGNMKISVTRGRFQYVFASEENKAAFVKSPERYEIQLGGSCARMGPQVGGNPDLYSVHEGRIYTFGSGNCKKAFDAAPEKFLEPAAAKELKATPEAEKKGWALIDKAVAAMGGAEKLDGLSTYQESGISTAIQQQQPVEVKTSITRAFPDSFRREDARSFGTTANVLAPGDSFGTFKNASRSQVFPMQPLAVAELRKQARLTPLEILRARKTEGFKVAAVGTDAVDGGAVEQVAVLFDGLLVHLGIDIASGRVLSLAYNARHNQSGEFGDIKKLYSDFRAVDGLTVAFKTQGTFNGQPDPTQSYNLESVSFNIKVEPSLFEKPKPTGGQ